MSFEDIRKEIKEFRYKNSHNKSAGLLNSFCKLNGKSLINRTFINSELYQKIIKVTDFLPDDVGIRARLVHILHSDLTEIPKCPICGNPVKILNKPETTTIFANTCGSINCTRELVAQFNRTSQRNISETMRKNWSNTLHRTKAREREIFLRFKDECFRWDITSSNISFEDVKQFIHNRMYNSQYKKKVFVKQSDYSDEKIKTYLFYIFNKTKFLPYIDDNQLRFRWYIRFYLVYNDIDKLPTCPKCGKELKFASFEKGFYRSCISCMGDTIRVASDFPTIKEMKSMIDTTKYDILYFPTKDFKNNYLKIKCKKCGSISEHSLFAGRGKYLKNKPLCRVCEQYSSLWENEIANLIIDVAQTDNVEIIKNDRSLIYPYELDIVVKNKDTNKIIAFELDGLYYHSSDVVSRGYHLLKTTKCNKLGIILFHIFENEWTDKRDIVIDRIKTLLGHSSKKIYARNCVVKHVPQEIAQMFLSENHIQGCSGTTSKYNFGLYFDDELVSIMTFGTSRYNKKYQYELLRFCSKLGYTIVGGASKLLKHFENEVKPTSLISYADRRWSVGNVYYKLGFNLISYSSPSYWYFKNAHHVELESRFKYQKHKLSRILKIFDKDKSEWENMKANGYKRIYDCGNLVFVKTY